MCVGGGGGARVCVRACVHMFVFVYILSVKLVLDYSNLLVCVRACVRLSVYFLNTSGGL